MAVAPLSLSDIKDVNTFADTFWAKVDFGNGPDDCWMWQASLTDKGYGNVAVPLWGHYRSLLAHRISWLLTYGELPLLFMCHRCDVRYEPRDFTYRACVNPDHLFAGTGSDNTQDMYNKGRGRTVSAVGEKHGLTTITNAQAVEIRCLYSDGASQNNLAAMYGIAQATVSRILRRETWSSVGGPAMPSDILSLCHRGERNGKAVLTEDDVRSIRIRAASGESQASLSREYGVKKPAIDKIVNRRTWKHVA